MVREPQDKSSMGFSDWPQIRFCELQTQEFLNYIGGSPVRRGQSGQSLAIFWHWHANSRFRKYSDLLNRYCGSRQ